MRRRGLFGRVTFVWLALVLALAGCEERAPASRADTIRASTARVDDARIRAADTEPGNWLAHGRTYDEQRFSPLREIDRGNVAKLGLAWSFDTGVGRGHEATPIVVDGVMFVTLPWSVVVALDARTGEVLWKYDPEVPRPWARKACCDVVNRGVAVWKARVYVGTLDGRLVALDAGTGAVVWDVNTIDRDKPYTITGAPRVVKGKVVIGNGGAEYGVRGYVTAYDAETGAQLWRFYTVPGDPSQPFEHPELEAAAKTWHGRWWENGGGGTAWDSMAYDPELDLLYVGTGNGSPWSRKLRSPGGGDNLYLSSILALRPDTGRLVWHYQTTPGDNWDYTAVQHILLADLDWHGAPRKVLMQAPKNGFFYVLDRATGELLSAEKFVRVNWASRVDPKTGRPVETPEGNYDERPRWVLPSPNGGHLWHPMSYSPETKLVYIPALELPFLYAIDPKFEPVKGVFNIGLDLPHYPAHLTKYAPEMPAAWGELKAWDPVQQKAVWTVKHPGSFNGGVLSTAGGLVFQGTSDGRFAAYAADSGQKLWEITTNIGIVAPPISFSVDGRQYVSVLAGWGGGGVIEGSDAGISAASRYVNQGHLFTFALGASGTLPEIPLRNLAVADPLPELDAAPGAADAGSALFHRYCLGCHGILAVTSGVVPDLRYASLETHAHFADIVLGGTRAHMGMASFADVLSADDVRAIQAYVIRRARETKEAESASGSALAVPVAAQVQTKESQDTMTPALALERLQDGNARFVTNATKPRDWSAKVVATAAGQFPFAAVLGCMDSRAPVEIVFDQGLGDVFGVRVAGNVVNDDELGSLEYAAHVGTKLLVVLGHTRCGAVKGAIEHTQLGNLTGLLDKIEPAVEAAGCSDAKDEACVTSVAEQNVRNSMKEIRARSPYLAKYLDEGKLELVGAMYDVSTGKVTFLPN